jgi:hypothetical protein
MKYEETGINRSTILQENSFLLFFGLKLETPSKRK